MASPFGPIQENLNRLDQERREQERLERQERMQAQAMLAGSVQSGALDATELESVGSLQQALDILGNVSQREAQRGRFDQALNTAAGLAGQLRAGDSDEGLQEQFGLSLQEVGVINAEGEGNPLLRDANERLRTALVTGQAQATRTVAEEKRQDDRTIRQGARKLRTEQGIRKEFANADAQDRAGAVQYAGIVSQNNPSGLSEEQWDEDGRARYGDEWGTRKRDQINLARSMLIQQEFGERTASAANKSFIISSLAEEMGITPGQAALFEKGLGFQDPISNEFITSRNATEMEEARYALLELTARVPLLMDAYQQVRADPRMVGPIVGTDTAQGILRNLGVQSGAAAAYQNQQREFVSILLKARQGSRPSDFDLQFYLSLIPSLTETFNPESAQARFDAMNQSLELAKASAMRGSKVGKQVAGIKRSAGLDAADGRVERMAQQFAAGEIDIIEWSQELEAWQQRRGGLFHLPSAGALPPGQNDSAAARSTLDKVFGGQ
ncbi:hypothetical protein [uncultured Mediterranean phage]|nr:hypothetical protein [uncultured Mediterranean phage]